MHSSLSSLPSVLKLLNARNELATATFVQCLYKFTYQEEETRQ